jgi:dihydroxyacetone kinase-like protein
MNAEKIFNNLNQIKLSIDEHQQELEKLDQEIGDGDHIFNIQRGINESIELKDQLIGLEPSEVLKEIGMKVMTTVGGSSGALFATLLISMSKKYNYQLTNQKNIASMFTNGVESMKKRGKADLGEKTMLDVLIPVSIELQKLSNYEDVKYIARRVKEVAKKGMLSTENLIATKGRASYLGERSKGHIDPGARSSQLAIEAICNTIINT